MSKINHITIVLSFTKVDANGKQTVFLSVDSLTLTLMHQTTKLKHSANYLATYWRNI